VADCESDVDGMEERQLAVTDARTIAAKLDGVTCDNGYKCRCPVLSHGKGKGDAKRSLFVRDDNRPGRVFVHCYAECEWRDIVAELRRMGLWGGGVSVSSSQKAPAPKRDYTPLAREIWRNSVPAAGTLVELYLRSRAITIPPPPTLRFHAALAHKPSRTVWPAMVALVTRGKSFLAIHRTYLARDGSGKAPLGEEYDQKMSLAPISGGAIRLGPVQPTVCIAEGIETALSVMQATGLTAWAAISAGNFKKLELPDDVREIIICADPDPTGQDMANKASDRWMLDGRTVRIALPPPGQDFNDVLRE
jgi:putative DNA primase/helicase